MSSRRKRPYKDTKHGAILCQICGLPLALDLTNGTNNHKGESMKEFYKNIHHSHKAQEDVIMVGKYADVKKAEQVLSIIGFTHRCCNVIEEQVGMILDEDTVYDPNYDPGRKMGVSLGHIAKVHSSVNPSTHGQENVLIRSDMDLD